MSASFVLMPVIGSVLASVAAMASTQATDEPSVTDLRGRCDYRPEVLKSILPDTGLALCNSVRIERNADASVIDFRQTLGGSQFRYEGTWTGDGMAINRLAIRGRAPKPATGDCTVYRNAGQISTITCIAKAERKAFAANFVASRVNR
ncbi:hypothetical protein [Blastomonas sp.]|uniref:hypothetical protein n=1 Tax=Blastomonas sp. TaxID=1909299 RepID=UPI00391A4794